MASSTAYGTPRPPGKHHHTNGTESPLSGTTLDDIEDVALLESPIPDDALLLSPGSANILNLSPGGSPNSEPLFLPDSPVLPFNSPSVLSHLSSEEDFLTAHTNASSDDLLIKQVIMAKESGNQVFLAEALDAGLDPNYIIDPNTNDTLLHVFTIEVRQHHTLSGPITMAYSSHERPVILSI